MNIKFELVRITGKRLLTFDWVKGSPSKVNFEPCFKDFKLKYPTTASEIETFLGDLHGLLKSDKCVLEYEYMLNRYINYIKSFISIKIIESNFRSIPIESEAKKDSFELFILDYKNDKLAELIYCDNESTVKYTEHFKVFNFDYPNSAEHIDHILKFISATLSTKILYNDDIDKIIEMIDFIEKQPRFKLIHTYNNMYTDIKSNLEGIKQIKDKASKNDFNFENAIYSGPLYNEREENDIAMGPDDIEEDYVDIDSAEIRYDKNNKRTSLTFNDVVGMDEVKDKLNDVILQVKNYDKYKAWDIKPIRGILLHGPSGTGKSYISEAFANEIDAEFFPLSTADILHKYLGESAKRIRAKFEEARKCKLAILYIDEIDAIASKRDSFDSNKEKNATLNELLVQMSSPENDNIIMIFATNMIDLLDPAFLRSGRCDFKIEVPLPDYECRKGILELNSKNRPISENVDFEKIARNMSGMNCADVAHIANEAARIAIKHDKESIDVDDFNKAFEEMICGAKSKTKRLNEKEKEIVAVHETGHLLANEFYKVNKVKKISILPRGNTLGFVLHVNEENEDKFLNSQNDLLNQIKVCLAGRAAEELFFGDITTGASNDLEKATKIATDMAAKYGFVKELGLSTFNLNNPNVIQTIQPHIDSILSDCYADIMNVMVHNKETIKHFSNILKDKEEMNGEEIKDVLSGICIE